MLNFSSSHSRPQLLLISASRLLSKSSKTSVFISVKQQQRTLFSTRFRLCYTICRIEAFSSTWFGSQTEETEMTLKQDEETQHQHHSIKRTTSDIQESKTRDPRHAKPCLSPSIVVVASKRGSREYFDSPCWDAGRKLHSTREYLPRKWEGRCSFPREWLFLSCTSLRCIERPKQGLGCLFYLSHPFTRSLLRLLFLQPHRYCCHSWWPSQWTRSTAVWSHSRKSCVTRIHDQDQGKKGLFRCLFVFLSWNLWTRRQDRHTKHVLETQECKWLSYGKVSGLKREEY